MRMMRFWLGAAIAVVGVLPGTADPGVASADGTARTTLSSEGSDSFGGDGEGALTPALRAVGFAVEAPPRPRAPAPGGVRPTSGYFHVPSRNIQCGYGFGRPRTAGVVCGIKSGLEPPPPTRGPECSEPSRVFMGATGRAKLSPSICPGEPEGDSGPFAPASVAWVLAYGKSVGGGGIRCTSKVAGLTCRNRSGRGFFLSRNHWRLF